MRGHPGLVRGMEVRVRRSIGLVGSILVLVVALTAAGALLAAPATAEGACILDAEPNDEPSIAAMRTGDLQHNQDGGRMTS